MPKYLILYRSATSAEDRMAAASAEEQKAGMDAWMQWKNKVEAADVKFEFGMPVQIRKHVADAVTDGKSDVTGYSTMEGDSVDEVVGNLRDHPHLKETGNSIDVLEMLRMEGM
jgi:hypothetical protein